MGRYYEGDIEGKFVFGAQSSTAADRFGVEGTTPGYVDYNFDTSNLKDLELELKNIENKIGEYAYYLKAYYDLYGLETILYGDDLNISFEDYLEKIKGGWADVDVIIATPESMAELGRLGRILGPKGLMPNPKSGTVTKDVAKAVNEVKAGKIEFRVDKTGIVHSSLGKLNFETDKLVDNANAFINTIIKLKPATTKGQYVKSLFLSSSMGPGLKIIKDEIPTR